MASECDRQSFDDSFPALYRAAHRAAYRILGDHQSAEDVAVEACYRSAVRWARVRDHAVPWTVRVASNLALDHARVTRRLLPGRRDDREPASGAERMDLVNALRSLPQRQREVVVLRYLGDLTEADTADVLGIAPGTVKAHSHRGLAALRSRLADDSLTQEELA